MFSLPYTSLAIGCISGAHKGFHCNKTAYILIIIIIIIEGKIYIYKDKNYKYPKRLRKDGVVSLVYEQVV